MTHYIVTSDRMRWPKGTRLSGSDLVGVTISALVEGGHLAPAPAPILTKAAKAAAAPDGEE